MSFLAGCARAGHGLIVIAVTAVLLAITLRACSAPVHAPNGTGAIKAITTIHTAQVQYFSNYGLLAASMRELGPPASGADGPSGANLIERDLANGEKGGYRFTLTATPAGYNLSAVPSQFGISGRRTYFSDQGMGIHIHFGPSPATMDDPLLLSP